MSSSWSLWRTTTAELIFVSLSSVALLAGVPPLVPVEDYSWVNDAAAVKAYHDRIYQEELAKLLNSQAQVRRLLVLGLILCMKKGEKKIQNVIFRKVRHERDAEIAEIKQDIAAQKRRWKPVYR